MESTDCFPLMQVIIQCRWWQRPMGSRWHCCTPWWMGFQAYLLASIRLFALLYLFSITNFVHMTCGLPLRLLHFVISVTHTHSCWRTCTRTQSPLKPRQVFTMAHIRRRTTTVHRTCFATCVQSRPSPPSEVAMQKQLDK